ncbi:peptidylprolyl isomerase [candidate division KSB1 bacterium]|nr:peptidylprolyl isomerase [candidate division KSB1 bacterium]
MKKHLIFIYLAVFMIFTMFSPTCERRPVVARVGNYVISLQDLEQEIQAARTPANSLSEVLKIVDRLVEEKLKLMDAYNSGFEQDSVVLSRMNDFETREVLSNTIERDVIRKVISKKMIRQRYENAKEWQVRHIFMPLTQDSAQAMQQLNSLRARALRGEDFGALAREYSRDAKSAGKNGDLGFIRWDVNSWGEAFMQQVAALREGQVSKAFVSDKGLHLVKVAKIRAVAQGPFEKEKENIERQLIRENSARLDSAYFAYRDAMFKKYDGQIFRDKIDTILVLIDATEKNHTEEKVNLRRDPRQFAGFLSLSERQIPLASFRGGEYTFAELLTTYERISPMRRPALVDTAAVLEFLNRNVPRKIMIHHGYKTRMQRCERVRKAVLRQKENAMIQRIQRLKIDQNAEITDEELVAHYNANTHLYEENVRVKVQELQLSDSTRAREIHQKALTEDFTTLVRNFGDNRENNDDGMLGYVTRRDHGEIGRAAVKMKAGEISEPIKIGNRYSIIKILERQADAPKPFDQVRLAIRREKRIARRDQLNREWMDELRKKYPVFVYRDVIEKEREQSDE